MMSVCVDVNEVIQRVNPTTRLNQGEEVRGLKLVGSKVSSGR